jgi:4'-phosphopantetheinyl transferase
MDDPGPADRNPNTSWPEGPARPPSPAGTIDLWLADLEAEGWPSAADLPSAERERAARSLRPGPAAQWVAARWALRIVLGRYLGEEPAGIALATAAGGKPRLAVDPERLGFNLSHSGGLALIAIAAGLEVGVDLERAEPGRDFAALAERSFEPAAAAAIREAPPERRAELFYAPWTRHEARAKCGGGGIWTDTAHPPTMTTVEIAVRPGYAAALAVVGTMVPPLHEWSIGPPPSRVRR